VSLFSGRGQNAERRNAEWGVQNNERRNAEYDDRNAECRPKRETQNAEAMWCDGPYDEKFRLHVQAHMTL